jgi:predicted kinase
MRKWMRERMQRRKKPAESSSQAAPPPLQPAYFDAEQTPGAVPEASQSDSAASPGPEVAAQAETRPARRPRLSAAAPEDQSSIPESSLSESPAAPSSASDSSAIPSSTPPPTSRTAPSRGRRRRGGRGRGGRGREQAVAQAFAPAAVKGSAPVLEPAEEIQPGEGEFADAAPPQLQTPEAPKAPAIPTAQARLPKGVVVLAIGLPGSGKSSWFKRHNVVPLSSDLMRSLLFDDVREQRFQDLVFSNLRSMLKARLIARRPMNYVDATNLTPQERQHWIKLAKDYQYEVHAIFFDVPLDVCIERHQRRDRVVPDEVMRRMAAKLKPPTFEEGFAKITVVRVKKKEAE